MSLKRLCMFLSLATPLLVAQGCHSTAANLIEVPAPGAQARVSTLNSGLASDVKIVTGKSFYVDDLLEAVVTIESLEDEPLALEVFWEFYDADGVLMDDTTALWRPLTLAALASKQVKSLAPRAGAVRGRFMVRWPLED
jgi:uncharacterized protein YcfL